MFIIFSHNTYVIGNVKVFNDITFIIVYRCKHVDKVLQVLLNLLDNCTKTNRIIDVIDNT